MPISTFSGKGPELQKLAVWYKLRGIPASRKNIDKTLEQVGVNSLDDLLHKGYGLSLSDHYWYCPCDEELDWNDINFFDNDFSDDLGKYLVGEEVALTTDELNMRSPNGTLKVV